MRYKINEFELDATRFELTKNGEVQHVEPQVFDLLHFFSKNPGLVFSRDEIIENVWDGRIVSDATISSCIKQVRKALGDTGANQTYVRTVRGRGFQFVADVKLVSNDTTADKKTSASKHGEANHTQTRPLPSLAIMPLELVEDDQSLKSGSLGLIENLKTILTRIPLLSVHAVHAATAPPSTTYLLTGSMQYFDAAVRTNIHLSETKNGLTIWSRHFDNNPDDQLIRNLLDQILPHLEPELTRAMFNDLRDETGDLNSRQLLLRAMGLLSLKGWHKTTFEEAAELLRQSIELEPDFALSHAFLSLILGLGHRVGILRGETKEQSDAVIKAALKEAEIAIELDNMDSRTLGLAGCALADIGEVERALPLLQKAVEINPNNSQAFAALGSAYLLAGDVDAAIKNLTHGINISPMDNNLSIWNALLAFAHMRAGDLASALNAANDGSKSDDKSYLPRVACAATHLLLEDQAKTKAALKDCYRVKPDLTLTEIEGLVGTKLAARLTSLQE